MTKKKRKPAYVVDGIRPLLSPQAALSHRVALYPPTVDQVQQIESCETVIRGLLRAAMRACPVVSTCCEVAVAHHQAIEALLVTMCTLHIHGSGVNQTPLKII